MPARKKAATAKPIPILSGSDPALVSDLRDMILSTRQTDSRGVNAALVMLYWNVGKRIRQDILDNERAGYGDRIVSAQVLSRRL